MHAQSTPTEVLPGYEDVAALYARVSTDPQEAKRTSHEEQLRVMRDRLAALGLREGMAVEETYSAGTRHRPQLDRLMRDVRAGKIGVVMVAYADRFVRDQIDLGVLLDTFRDCGVGLVSAREHLDSRTHQGVMMWGQLASFAEFEHKGIFRRTMDARLANARKGRQPTTPRRVYGYRYDKAMRTWEKDKHEADIVGEMFTWVAGGATFLDVAQRLTERGIPSPNGMETWGTSTISRIIRNSSYIGVTWAFHNKPKAKSVRRFSETAWAEHHRAGGQPIRLDGVYPRIVSDDLFQRAQERARENKERARRNTKQDYFLRSLMTCAVCGRAYTGVSTSRDGKTYCYYRCASYGDPHGRRCGAPHLHAAQTDMQVWETVVEGIDPDTLREKLITWREEQGNSEAARELASIQARITESEEQTRRLLALVSARDTDDTERAWIEGRREELRRMRVRLVEREAELVGMMQREMITTEEIDRAVALTRQARANLKALPPAERRVLLDVLGARVTVHEDKSLTIVLRTGTTRQVDVLPIVHRTSRSAARRS